MNLAAAMGVEDLSAGLRVGPRRAGRSATSAAPRTTFGSAQIKVLR
jgi:hypothetical protein